MRVPSSRPTGQLVQEKNKNVDACKPAKARFTYVCPGQTSSQWRKHRARQLPASMTGRLLTYAREISRERSAQGLSPWSVEGRVHRAKPTKSALQQKPCCKALLRDDVRALAPQRSLCIEKGTLYYLLQPTIRSYNRITWRPGGGREHYGVRRP